MFETIKTGQSISKEQFREEQKTLRTDLIIAQQELRKAGIATLLVLYGSEGAGRGEVVNCISKWLDTRNIHTHAFWDETDESLSRPTQWRYWITLPPRGNMSIVFGGIYHLLMAEKNTDKISQDTFTHKMAQVVVREQMLVEDGMLIVKVWLHLPQKVQKKRIEELLKDNRSRWKMFPEGSKFNVQYEKYEANAADLVRHTDHALAPWNLLDASDRQYRDIAVGKILLAAMQNRLAEAINNDANPKHLNNFIADELDPANNVLDNLKLNQDMDKDEYKTKFKALSHELGTLFWEAWRQHRSTILVFEGIDAAGKGGIIRRITDGIDARLYRTIPTSAPNDEELAYHYLWRFWRQIARAGYLRIFDRSWYGRVLVERVEGFASFPEWQRAYQEINQFEDDLVDSNIILMKFWVQIDQDSQLERFKLREKIPYKNYKITPDDWRNRDKWEDYKLAAIEMFRRTSSLNAPWILVEGNNKYFARIKVLTAIRDKLKAELHSKK